MKNKIITLLIFCTIAISSFGQTFSMRTYLSDFDYIAVQLSQETLGAQPDPISSDDGITNLVFTVRWLQSIGDVDVDIICTNYNITESGTRGEKDSYYYQSFSCASPVTSSPDDYVLGEPEDIALLQATFSGTPTSGTFEIAPSLWATSITLNVEWNNISPSAAYSPALVTGTCDGATVPTIVYDLVWTGASAYPEYWDWAANWETACGAAGSIPNTGDNCIIPVVLSGNYPSLINDVAGMGIHQPMCDYLRINVGASLATDDLDNEGPEQVTYTIISGLKVYGTLNILSDGQMTVTGDTYLDAAECLVVQATSAGVGSFIDNGTITYGASGTAKVQTYLANDAVAPNFDFHLVGPTIAGATLEDFNASLGHTFAYNYVVASDTWGNIYTNDPISTGSGIGISTDDGDPSTINMIGELKTGGVSSPSLLTTGSGNNLLSNPYPSSVYWNDLYDNNSGVNDKVYIYDGTNYLAYNAGSGGTDEFSGYLQVGQGFFVEATGTSAFTFDNGDRYHSNDPFYKSNFSNRLDVRVSGNESTDGLLVHFYEDAVSGYEANEDAAKKMSYSENATQFWTVLEDGQHMSINAMPLELLGKGMHSVPVGFICSSTSDYTMNFLDVETFDMGSEIWLEDKLIGGDWVSVNDNPDYTFTATPEDDEDRFVIHFFGPTGVDEFGIENTVNIYGYRQNAFVRNNTNEDIKEVRIYTLSGELLRQIDTVNNKLSKYWVSDKLGYYVVHVITNKNVYTNKVFISK